MMIMKNLKVIQVATFCIIVIMFISSCSMMKSDDFAKQKYTNFKKGEASVNINNVTKEKKNADKYCMVSEKKEAAESDIITADKPSQSISTIVDEQCQSNETLVPEVKHKNIIKVRKANFIQKAIKKVILKRAVSLVMREQLKKTSTVSYVDNSNLLLLAILSFLLPPLAVYLVRGIGNSFWIDLILTLLFWIPGVIFALIVVFDVK